MAQNNNYEKRKADRTQVIEEFDITNFTFSSSGARIISTLFSINRKPLPEQDKPATKL